MAAFTDPTGRAWPVNLTVGHLAPLKDLAGFDLNQATRDADSFAKLWDLSPAQLVEALYLVCAPAVERAGLTPEGWAHLFDAPTWGRAYEAFVEAVMDFFPRSKVAEARRESLKRVMEAADRKMIREVEARTTAALNGPTSSPIATN